MIRPECDDDWAPPDRTPLYAAIAGGVLAIAAAIAPEWYRDRRERREKAGEDALRLARMEATLATLAERSADEGSDDDD